MDFRPKDSSVLFLFLSDRRIVNGCQLSSVQEEGCRTLPQHLEHYTLLNIVEHCWTLNIAEHCWTLNIVEHCTCWTLHTLNIVQHYWTLHTWKLPKHLESPAAQTSPCIQSPRQTPRRKVKKNFGVIIQQKDCTFFSSFPFLLWVHIIILFKKNAEYDCSEIKYFSPDKGTNHVWSSMIYTNMVPVI